MTANTKLLLHAESLADSSFSNHAQSFFGAASCSNALFKFNSSSFKLMQATSDYIMSSSNGDYDFGMEDFTIDWWVYEKTATKPLVSISRHRDATFPPYLLNYNGSIFMSSNGQGWDIATNRTFGAPVYNAWHHLEIGRKNGTFYAFRNGVLKDTWSSPLAFPAVNKPLCIGSGQFGGCNMNGYMDEIRVSKGICHHTANFTPPTDPYESAPRPAYGQVVATAVANNNDYIDLIDPTGFPCDHYELEFYHAVSDIETPPNEQSGAVLTAFVTFDGGQAFKTDAHYNNNGTSLFAGEDNPIYLTPSPYGVGNPQTLNLGFRLSVDTGDFREYGATGSADIYNAGGHTIYTSSSYKGAIGGNSDQIRSNGTLPINQRGQKWFPSNGSQYFHWAIPVTYAGHYDGAPGQRPNGFRLTMSGGENTVAKIESGIFKLRRMD